MENPSKFFNVIIDKTNQKLNSFQAQIIVLESQLQMANDERDTYKKYVDNLPSINHDIEAYNKLKNDYALLEKQFRAYVEEQELQHRSATEVQVRQYEESVRSLKEQLQSALDKNAEQEEKIKILQSNINDRSNFIRDQNETLLQEIKRLKAEMAEMSNK
jgi:peptidoglycan hydrolase CwlO-like protein